jgi:hypothetical protein
VKGEKALSLKLKHRKQSNNADEAQEWGVG